MFQIHFQILTIFCQKFGILGIFFCLVYCQLIFLISGKSHQMFNITKLKLKKQTHYCPPQMEGLNFINPTLPYYFWIMLKRHIPLVASFATNYIIFRNVDILTPKKILKNLSKKFFWWRKLKQFFKKKISKKFNFRPGIDLQHKLII
jgi:hypothetical protein